MAELFVVTTAPFRGARNGYNLFRAALWKAQIRRRSQPCCISAPDGFSPVSGADMQRRVSALAYLCKAIERGWWVHGSHRYAIALSHAAYLRQMQSF